MWKSVSVNQHFFMTRLLYLGARLHVTMSGKAKIGKKKVKKQTERNSSERDEQKQKPKKRQTRLDSFSSCFLLSK